MRSREATPWPRSATEELGADSPDYASSAFFPAYPDHDWRDTFRPGGHGATEEGWNAIFDFADQYLLGKPATRRFDVIPPAKDLP